MTKQEKKQSSEVNDFITVQVMPHQSSLKTYFEENVKLLYPTVNVWGDKNAKRPLWGDNNELTRKQRHQLQKTKKLTTSF